MQNQGSSDNFHEQQKNLICNFRAPSIKEYAEWQEFKEYVKGQGLDICRITIGLTNAFMNGVKSAEQAKGREQVVNIQMNNQFLYQVSKPRREPYSLDCVKPEFQRTISSIFPEAYILNKARDLNREFSFRDFLEFNYDSFRRIMVRLRRKGKIVAHPQRTNPRFYYLTQKLREYETSNNTIE